MAVDPSFLYIPRLNSTIPSSPALSQNSGSKDLAATAWRWGKAARASGRAKMDVVRIKPVGSPPKPPPPPFLINARKMWEFGNMIYYSRWGVGWGVKEGITKSRESRGERGGKRYLDSPAAPISGASSTKPFAVI